MSLIKGECCLSKAEGGLCECNSKRVGLIDYELLCCKLEHQLADAEKVIELILDKKYEKYASSYRQTSELRCEARAYLDKYKDKQ